jgi:hypothetical protein
MSSRWVNSVFLQPFAVLSSASTDVTSLEPGGTYVRESNTSEPMTAMVSSSPIFKSIFSSVPVVWESELAVEYHELGEALGQMTDLENGDEWRIDRAVFDTACFVAAGLFLTEQSAPRVFTHGPKSIVFNWGRENADLYLTISADRVSALISSPERVQRRIDFSLNDTSSQALLLSAIQSTDPEPVRPLRLRGTVPDLFDVVG